MQSDVSLDNEELGAIAVDVDAIYAEMNRTGVGVLHNVIPQTFLDQVRDYIGDQLACRGQQYFTLGRADGIGQTPLRPLIHHADLHAAMHALYDRSMGAPPPDDQIVPVLRVLAGTVGVRFANRFHYDSYVVTALVPIIIPHAPGEPAGHLVMYPNLREARRRVLVNVVEKAVVQSSAARRVWRTAWAKRLFGARIVPLTPGNVYFFWGMRSLHANEACLPSSVRATALLHFGDPHAGSPLKHLSQSLHQRSLQRLQQARR